MMDTIFAVSSGQPPAAIAVLRVSGPQAAAAAEALAGPLPTPRRAVMRRRAGHNPAMWRA
ncbi:MAG: tRNA uridine-5-carboxymethylaminomethyl(34) synthesis GTPase MnmE, partial [Sphingomonas bacterium]